MWFQGRPGPVRTLGTEAGKGTRMPSFPWLRETHFPTGFALTHSACLETSVLGATREFGGQGWECPALDPPALLGPRGGHLTI